MKRILIAGVLGAVVYFIWGMAAWMILPLHTPTVSGLSNEQAVTEVLKKQNLETGVYVIPHSADEEDWSNADSEWYKNHRSGPLYSIYYQKEGSEPMSALVLGRGFVIDLLASLVAACLLTSAAGGCCGGYIGRVGFVMGLGVFVALIGHASYWNWMHFPLDYSIAFMIDVIVGWTLNGLVIAAVIRRPSPA